MKTKSTFDDLMKVAKSYGCEDNALFINAAKQYEVQQKVIDDIRAILEDGEDYLTTKEYVKGRQNVYANPLVKELPKLSDSANKTLQTMLNIIEQFGREPIKESPLQKMMNE